jgi:hypothetical protein
MAMASDAIGEPEFQNRLNRAIHDAGFTVSLLLEELSPPLQRLKTLSQTARRNCGGSNSLLKLFFAGQRQGWNEKTRKTASSSSRFRRAKLGGDIAYSIVYIVLPCARHWTNR